MARLSAHQGTLSTVRVNIGTVTDSQTLSALLADSDQGRG